MLILQNSTLLVQFIPNFMKNQIVSIYFPYEKSYFDGISKIARALENHFSPKDAEIHFLGKEISKEEACALKGLFNNYKCFIDEVGEYIPDESDCFLFAIFKICKREKAIFINPVSKIELDLGKLASVSLGEYYVGAYHDISFDTSELSRYCEEALGISHYLFTNSDCAVFNVKKLRENGAYERYMLYRSFCDFDFMRASSLFNLVFKENVY